MDSKNLIDTTTSILQDMICMPSYADIIKPLNRVLNIEMHEIHCIDEITGLNIELHV